MTFGDACGLALVIAAYVGITLAVLAWTVVLPVIGLLYVVGYLT